MKAITATRQTVGAGVAGKITESLNTEHMVADLDVCTMPCVHLVHPLPYPSHRMPLPNPSNTTTLPPNPDTGSYFLPQAPGGARLKVVAGHHDAGDYGKYVINSGSLVGWLMHALDILGAENDDLPLPEAGDGIPDIVQVCCHACVLLGWGC